MSTLAFVKQLKETIVELKNNGTATIDSNNLINYLEDIINSPSTEIPESELERYKADLQMHVENQKSNHASDLEMFKTVIQAGQNAIKSSFLLNGGAAVALLAFIGKITTASPSKIAIFAFPLMIFVGGVLAISLTSAFTYLTQRIYILNTEKAFTVGNALNLFTILLGLSSYCFFIFGMYKSYLAFITF